MHQGWVPLAGPVAALPKQADTGIDSAGSASTVVLREVHCALLRVIQSQGVERDKKDVPKGQPTTAKLFSPDSSGPVPWTAQVAQAILAAPAATTAATAKVRCPVSCFLLRLRPSLCNQQMQASLLKTLAQTTSALAWLHQITQGHVAATKMPWVCLGLGVETYTMRKHFCTEFAELISCCWDALCCRSGKCNIVQI